jgi:hypothetical protein
MPRSPRLIRLAERRSPGLMARENVALIKPQRIE